MGEKVLVAMSGGVDSSLSAYLLKEAGYEVVGATMKLWSGEARSPAGEGLGASYIDDARRVAEMLNIPHQVIDLEEEFEKSVVQYFCREYAMGRTPNPCIRCNATIKFGVMLKKALEQGARYMATGHYATLASDDEKGGYLLRKGKDPAKDQSYFLFTLTQDQFRHVLFPLGSFRKEEVKKRAFQLGLPVHDRPESQEVCFIADASYHAFLRQRLKGTIEPGPIMDREGNTLGKHEGIPFYTIGQRRGLRLTRSKPAYVIKIDPVRNALIVGEEEEVLSDLFIVERVQWVLPREGGEPTVAQVKIRYNHPGEEAVLTPSGKGEWRVQYRVPQKAITPGQAAVFYDGETVLGGGWIRETVRNSDG